MTKKKNNHIINLYVEYEIKAGLEELARRREVTLSDVIRRIFRVGIPILTRLWDTEDQLVREQCELLREFGDQRRADCSKTK